MPDLSTKTARRRLDAGEKFWTRIKRGRALGYRRPEGSKVGTWYVRVYDGDTSGSPYIKRAIGTADDVASADGDEVLTYAQAVEVARDFNPDEPEALEADEDLTVGGAVQHYLDWYKVHRKAYKRVKCNMDAHVLPELGEVRIEDLSTRRLRSWHHELAEKPKRLRGEGNTREAKTPDEKRARKVTANHVLKDLKAALNRAVSDGLWAGGEPWQKVEKFRGVEKARADYLEAGEAKRLLNACGPDLRDLVAAALHTGCRYSELGGLCVRDYRPEAAAVHIATSKSGKGRHVYLSDEGVALFDRLTAGREDGETLLTKEDGSTWGRNHAVRPLKAACETAGLEPINFHQLRHTYASLYLMNGGSLVALAKQLGHTTTRMVEKHYGHLADHWRAEEAKKNAPSLGLEDGKVERMKRKAR